MEKYKKLKNSHVRELRNEETRFNYVSDEENVDMDETFEMNRRMWVEITSENVVDLQLKDTKPRTKIKSTRQLRHKNYISYYGKCKNSALGKPSKDFLHVHQENHNGSSNSSLVATDKDQDTLLSNDKFWGTQDSRFSMNESCNRKNNAGWNCQNSSYHVSDISIEEEIDEARNSTKTRCEFSTSPSAMLIEEIYDNNENEMEHDMNLSGNLYQELDQILSFECPICCAQFNGRESLVEHSRNVHLDVKSCVDIGLNEDQETETAELSQPLKITSCFSLVADNFINGDFKCTSVDDKSEQDVAPSIQSEETCMQNAEAQQHQLLICPKEDVLGTSNPPLSLPSLVNDEIRDNCLNKENISSTPNNLSHEPKRLASFKCPICDDTFATKECYHNHLREVHVRDYRHGSVVSKENSGTNRRKQSKTQISKLRKCGSGVPEMTDSVIEKKVDCIIDKSVDSSLKYSIPAQNLGDISIEELMQTLIHGRVSHTSQPHLSTSPKTLLDQPANQSLVPLEQEWKVDGNKNIDKKVMVMMLSTCKTFQNVMYNCPFCKVPHLLKHLAEHLEVTHSDELEVSLGKIKHQNTQAIPHNIMKETQTLDTRAGDENTTINTPCSNQVLHVNNSGKDQRIRIMSPKKFPDKIRKSSTNESKTKSSIDTMPITATLIDLTNDDSDHDEFPDTSSCFVCPSCGCTVALTKAHIYGFTILRKVVQVKCPQCISWHDLTVFKKMSNLTNNAIY